MPTNTFRFDDRVVLITGAGSGLGKSHALLFARLGAKVVVNDLGTSLHGDGRDASAAQSVVAQIHSAGGDAVANHDSVEQGERIVEAALDHFGRIDVVINNAGIIRDRSFHKMTDADWEQVYRVHMLGGYKVTHAAWPHLREQQYGRVLFTASAAGIYGNFGQANYSASKLGLYGLTRTLAVEGRGKNIHVNAVAPLAGSRLTDNLMPADMQAKLKPDYVSPLVAYLCHDHCEENGGLFEAGAGWYAKVRWERSLGVGFDLHDDIGVEDIAARFDDICDFSRSSHPQENADALTAMIANLQSGD